MLKAKRQVSGLILILLLMIGSGCSSAVAQDGPEVKKIRAAYGEVNNAIAKCGEGDEENLCGYYLNTMNVNRNGGPWAAVGIYQSTQDFWYQFADGEEGQEMHLRKVNVKTLRSSRAENEEFLFDEKGQLMFYYFKMTNGEVLGQELRFYFDKGKLVDYKEKVVEDEKEYQRYTKADFAAVLKDAKRYATLFEASFN